MKLPQDRFAEVNDERLLRRIKQKTNERIQEFIERYLSRSEDAYPRTVHNAEQEESIQKQLVAMFCDGVGFDYLKIKLLKAEPDKLEQSVEICMREKI